MTIVHGGCHCGAVRFRAEVQLPVRVQRCDCSICARTGFLHLIVPGSRFTLEQGEDRLTSYRFNTGVAQHLFCSDCGVKSYYVPRSNPDGYSLNLNCLDAGALPADQVTVEDFDGKDWESHGDALADLSKT